MLSQRLHNAELNCLKSIQIIRNCESHYNHTETVGTIQTNGTDVTARQFIPIATRTEPEGRERETE